MWKETDKAVLHAMFGFKSAVSCIPGKGEIAECNKYHDKHSNYAKDYVYENGLWLPYDCGLGMPESTSANCLITRIATRLLRNMEPEFQLVFGGNDKISIVGGGGLQTKCLANRIDFSKETCSSGLSYNHGYHSGYRSGYDKDHDGYGSYDHKDGYYSHDKKDGYYSYDKGYGRGKNKKGGSYYDHSGDYYWGSTKKYKDAGYGYGKDNKDKGRYYDDWSSDKW
jgi:hypothetical protein